MSTVCGQQSFLPSVRINESNELSDIVHSFFIQNKNIFFSLPKLLYQGLFYLMTRIT